MAMDLFSRSVGFALVSGAAAGQHTGVRAASPKPGKRQRLERQACD